MTKIKQKKIKKVGKIFLTLRNWIEQFSKWKSEVKFGIILTVIGLVFGFWYFFIPFITPILINALNNIVNEKVICNQPLFQGFNSLDSNFKVLILPFRPLENNKNKDINVVNIVEKELNALNKKTATKISIKVDSLFLISSSNLEIGQQIGNDLNADMVIWGDISEKCYPETSKTCIKYSLIPRKVKSDKRFGFGLITDANLNQAPTNFEMGSRPVPEINQIPNGYLLREANEIIYRISAAKELKNGNYLEALKYLNEINIDITIEKYLIYYYKGLCHLLIPLTTSIPIINSNDSSMYYFEKSIAANPEFADAYLNHGYCVMTKVGYYGQIDRRIALQDFSKCIELEPDNVLAYYNRGLSKEYFEDPVGAYLDLTKVIELDSLNVDAYFKRGEQLSLMGLFKFAISDYYKSYDIAKKHSPKSRIISFIFEMRGYAWEGLGIYPNAISDYENCLALGLGRNWTLIMLRRINECKMKYGKLPK